MPVSNQVDETIEASRPVKSGVRRGLARERVGWIVVVMLLVGGGLGCREPAPGKDVSMGSRSTASERVPSDLPAPDVQIGDIEWYRDYDQALEVARRLRRPLWLHFGEHPG